MNLVAKCLLICVVAGFSLSALAEDRVVELWNCELNEGMTQDDAQKVNSRWLKFVNENVDGGDIRSFALTPIVGAAGKFKYIDSFPSLEAWTAMQKALDSDEGRSITEAFNELQECSDNTLHNAKERPANTARSRVRE